MMAPSHPSVVLVFFVLLLSLHSFLADDSEDKQLFNSLNSYRSSSNLPALSSNENAACLADKIAGKYEDQPCTNTTGANTVPGTETQFSDYPDFLADCHLNVSNTRDGVIMLVCVPKLVPALVLSNFTHSQQYSRYLNDTKYVGAGIASEDNWIVAVLTTNTSTGSFQPYNAATSSKVVMSSLFLLAFSCFLLD
ncbi:hypothetical protein AMTRI_Chr01g115010 [Amborella trichopoda]|uniref:uncharacterized GPI-anchored protein At3g06035 n=1 Tax=Amborella trichopoda TaxID=13333 RepID=UPI0005D3C66D|nr:uncharacterized GPI-anchored protein At3g06035 [Amborella trichopoda]XP_020527052.1 uncharacterized GPI-anchored protein At3g06035 [Amborella trichopoda]|eukprot:XP_011625671.1 uncharacterized GPI-anchored protein At3g06035 [Amborella trichopoda]